MTTYSVDRMQVALKPGDGQGPPGVIAALPGQMQLTTYHGLPSMVETRTPQPASHRPSSLPDRQPLSDHGRPRRDTVRATGGSVAPRPVVTPTSPAVKADFAGVQLTDVAPQVGLDFRQGAFRYGVSPRTRRR